MCKVLVADDSGVMRKIVVRAVNAAGASDTVEAADGADALAKFRGAAFNLVLSDWNMPAMTGIEFLKAVREMGSKVPFVLITTETEKTRVLEAIQAGASDYIVKPFEAANLAKKLERFITPAAQ